MVYDFFKTNLLQVINAWPHIAALGGLFFIIADCRAKRTPVPYSADSLRHN